MTEDEYRVFVQKSYEYLQEQQDSCDMDWGIEDFGHWDMNQPAGELVFRNPTGPKLICQVQIAGTYSHGSRTWLCRTTTIRAEDVGPSQVVARQVESN